jgi:hypothetical protein
MAEIDFIVPPGRFFVVRERETAFPFFYCEEKRRSILLLLKTRRALLQCGIFGVFGCTVSLSQTG